jgi:L-lactate dehydrogenase complex protein LldG
MTDLVETFARKASVVSARVHRAATRTQAFDQAVAILKAKPLLDPQMKAAIPATDSVDDKNIRIMAAPNLDDAGLQQVSRACEASGGIRLLHQGLRDYPGGIDMGLTTVNYGIADTGTLVLNSNDEETRLATMLCEVHVAILAVSDIRETALSMTNELEALTRHKGSYTAFITGASRTADIERVLAIGVHGPLELHIILVEDQ